MVEKSLVRKEIFARRRSMSVSDYEDCSKRILENVLNSELYTDAHQLLIYVSFGKEVDTKQLIQHALEQKKQVLVPKVVGKNMIFVEIKSLNELTPGTMGILEPVSSEETLPSKACLMIMPGVAFDCERHRIGYGGGYYDRYLEKYPEIRTLAISFEYQILDHVPSEATDIKPKLLITERRVLS